MQVRPHRCRTGAVLPFTEVGFGSAPLGNLYAVVPEETAQDALGAAYELGIGYVDTAPLYGAGIAEERIGRFLASLPEDRRPLISTKVGRLLVDVDHDVVHEKFEETPRREIVFDYSYDGVLRSFEESLARLGVDRVDVLLCHDVDVYTHGSPAAADARLREFMEGGYRALMRLRDEGAVSAIGVGMNEWERCERLAREGEFDVFLVAGRYTLLEQSALDSFLPLCEEQGIGVVVGGPLNSGILAIGAKEGAPYDYASAPPAVLERVARLEEVCSGHGVRLIEAALRFPLAHPAVLSVIPGARTPDEVRENVQILARKMPSGLWDDLRRAGLLHPHAPASA